jgi:hypothetical protein
MSDDTQYKREHAFALFLARSHARNHGKPLPDPSSIKPLGFTTVKPTMSREQIKQNLLEAFKQNGITVKPAPEHEDDGGAS